MQHDMKYLDGRRFCLVLAKLVPGATVAEHKAQLRCLRGRANVDQRGYVSVEHSQGSFQLPPSCYRQILPADGTELLQDAEYFVICSVEGMDL